MIKSLKKVFLKLKNRVPSLVWLLLLVTFLKQIIFTAIVPIWHTPDEQAHFAQVAFFAEFGHMPIEGKDLNKEIYESEKLLGTLRDERGNNKFTFHPEYKIEFTQTEVGKYEDDVNNFPRKYRKELVAQEAANYPPLYYWLGAGMYKIFYQFGLVDRVFSVRFLSIMTSTLMVLVAWFIAREAFPKSEYLQVAAAFLVSFQPMLSFVGAGVTSDNLMNLLFSVLLLLCIYIFTKKISFRLIAGIVVTLFLLYLTKPQVVLGVPILLFSIMLGLIVREGIKKATLKLSIISLFGLLIGLTVPLWFQSLKGFTYLLSYQPGPNVSNNTLSFLTFFKQSLHHTYAEVIPWYWGVYDWLGVTYGRWVHRIINWLLVLTVLGVIVKVIKLFRNKIRIDGLVFIFLLFSTIIYYLGITFYNYKFTLGHGFPFGIQGRYFFPTIVPHMIIILTGLIALVPNTFKIRVVNFAVFLMLSLNFIAVWTITKTYYDLGGFNQFLLQVSQYKPLIFKGWFQIGWFIFYLSMLGWFVVRFNFTFLNRSRSN